MHHEWRQGDPVVHAMLDRARGGHRGSESPTLGESPTRAASEFNADTFPRQVIPPAVWLEILAGLSGASAADVAPIY